MSNVQVTTDRPYEGVVRIDSKGQLVRHLDELRPKTRLDAGETAAFSRSLEFIYAQTYDKLYPEYLARTLLPLNTSVPSGAEQHTFRQFDRAGEAMVIRDYGRDFPSVSLDGDEVRLPIVSIGASYEYSMQDVRASALMNLPLEARKALFTRQVIEQKLDSIAAWGVASATVTGLANAPGIIVSGTATGALYMGSTTNIASNNWVTSLAGGSSTVTQVLSDINFMCAMMLNASKGVFGKGKTLKLLVPTAVYSALAFSQAITSSGIFLSISVLQYILDTTPAIQDIVHWPALDKGAPGASATHDTVLLVKLDTMVCELVIPQDFEQMPPELHGMKFQVPCHMRCGGVKVTYPFGVLSYNLASG